MSMEEIKLADKIKCFGCSTCKSVCLHGAITMKKSEGFYYPSINNKRCKSCGLCIDNCIALQYEKVNANTIKGYFRHIHVMIILELRVLLVV